MHHNFQDLTWTRLARRSQIKMARVRKFSGKTVDEATEIALDEMDVALEEVDI